MAIKTRAKLHTDPPRTAIFIRIINLNSAVFTSSTDRWTATSLTFLQSRRDQTDKSSLKLTHYHSSFQKRPNTTTPAHHLGILRCGVAVGGILLQYHQQGGTNFKPNSKINSSRMTINQLKHELNYIPILQKLSYILAFLLSWTNKVIREWRHH